MLSDIENLIIKYLTKSATANDLDRLSEWISKPKNRRVFKEYVQIHYSIYYSMKEPNTEEVLNKLLLTLRKEKSVLYKLKSYYKYAAAVLVIGLMTYAYVFRNDRINKNHLQENIIVNQNNTIEPGTDKAILTLADGSQVILGKGTTFKKQNINSKGTEIIYKERNSEIEEIEYNYLTIPRAGQFFIKLSDGTKVWLNSESQLKYPVSFRNGMTRKVELVYGEAYFDVSPSTNHNGASFMVVNKSQEIEVLGTEFNIKAYLGESNIYTTLVEGKVVVSSGLTKQVLKPSQQSNLSIHDNKFMEIITVDVYNEISWKDGVFGFENTTLKEMMIVLSRWYDVEVIFKNKAIENEEFIGVLRKTQGLQEILIGIQNFGIIKNFEIYDNKVILE
ncbi:FecR family protein [Flavicella sp.]|uniref:FecR family protein n=1 Tax=Flavicella sp. TaxID=2957742 RepID=UPI00301984A9